MNLSACLALLLLLSAGSARAEEQEAKIKAVLLSAAVYTAPAGWTEEFELNQGDPQSLVSKDLHAIKIRLSGGPRSRYKSAGDYLAGLEARSKGGRPPEKTGTALISGLRVVVYRREVAVSLPLPGAGGPAAFAREEFCAFQAGKKFFILSYSYGDAVPDPSYDGLAAWRKFLKDFRLRKAGAKGK